MKSKAILGIIGIILAISLAAAVYYPAPFGQNLDLGDFNLTNGQLISARDFNGTNAQFDTINISGSLAGPVNWTYLQNYPSPCPGTSAITTINDSSVCSDLWFNIAGEETITGNMTFDGGGIHGLLFLNSTNWSNVTISETQIIDLQMYVSNQSNVNFYDINGTNISASGDLNVSAGISYLNTVNVTGNLTILDRVVFGLAETIDNLVDGWIRITGNTNITGSLEVGGNATIDGNVTIKGNLTIESSLAVGGNFTGNQIFGSLNGNGIGETIIPSSGTHYNISNTSIGVGNGVTWLTQGSADQINNSLTIVYPGIYHVVSQFSFSGSANEEYDLSLGVNSERQLGCHTRRKLGGGGDVGSSSYTCFIALSIGDSVTALIENVDAGNSATIQDLQLTILRIAN